MTDINNPLLNINWYRFSPHQKRGLMINCCFEVEGNENLLSNKWPRCGNPDGAAGWRDTYSADERETLWNKSNWKILLEWIHWDDSQLRILQTEKTTSRLLKRIFHIPSNVPNIFCSIIIAAKVWKIWMRLPATSIKRGKVLTLNCCDHISKQPQLTQDKEMSETVPFKWL